MNPSKEKYEKSLVKILIRLNPNVDADIIEFLNASDNKQGLIKEALREHIKKAKEVK